MDFGLLESLQQLVRRIVFRHEEGRFHAFPEGFVVRGYIHVLDGDDAPDMVDPAFADRVNGVWFPQDLLLDRVFCVVHFEPDDIAPVGHEGGDIPVAQVENPFDDLLFSFFNGALFGAFADDGLDLFFGDVVVGALDVQEPEQYACCFVQQPYERPGQGDEDPHGSGHPFGDRFGGVQAQAFRQQFSQDKGQEGEQDHHDGGGGRFCVGLDRWYALQCGDNIIDDLIAGIDTCEDADQGDAYLYGGQEGIRVAGQFEGGLCADVSAVCLSFQAGFSGRYQGDLGHREESVQEDQSDDDEYLVHG